MNNLCPTCRRRFAEAGFCPFDGTALVVDAADQTTLISAPQPVQRPDLVAQDFAPTQDLAPHELPTQLEVRKRTFPLTPSPTPGVPGERDPSTGEVTATRTRPGAVAPARKPRAPSDAGKIVARSASDKPGEALELYDRREHDYDKLIGQTLDGRYHVERKIGEGGMGVVFSARHAVIERPLAIKVLRREAMREAATIRRFVQEAKAASRIGHPNIVDVTDFGTTPDGMTYSVMELVPGQTLGSALKRDAPFPPLRALRIAAQIARALAAAHDKGIVHRDLKPENVFLLDRDGRPDFVKIVDFGIAKVTPPAGSAAEPRLTRAGAVFGTPEYMAPEQAAGRADTDRRVDIYALGVLLYEMICGRVPHRGDSMVRTLAMQMLDPVEPPSRVRPDLAIPGDLEAVILRALAKKRDDRFQTMGELLEALDGVMPPVVGQSVTGSPVYTLAALPPGADPAVVPAVPAMPLVSSDGTPPPGALASDPAHSAAHTQRRVKDEPVFTADERPVSFDHLLTDPATPLPRPRRWPLFALFGLIIGGAAGAIALIAGSHHAVIADAHRDAGLIAQTADAAQPPPPEDAPADAADIIVLSEPDAGPRVRPLRVETRPELRALRPDAGAVLPDTPNHRGTFMVQVITKPEGANLYEGTHYRGPGGAQLEEPYGAKLTITCRLQGYKPGTVEVSFDGNTTAVLCVLQRIKICINNIKNPFDDCELDSTGSASPPDPPR